MRFSEHGGSAGPTGRPLASLSTRELLLQGDIDALLASDRAGGGHAVGALQVQIELGRCRMLVGDLEALTDRVALSLDTTVGDPVNLYADDRLVARAELLVQGGCVCARIVEMAQLHGEAP